MNQVSRSRSGWRRTIGSLMVAVVIAVMGAASQVAEPALGQETQVLLLDAKVITEPNYLHLCLGTRSSITVAVRQILVYRTPASNGKPADTAVRESTALDQKIDVTIADPSIAQLDEARIDPEATDFVFKGRKVGKT